MNAVIAILAGLLLFVVAAGLVELIDWCLTVPEPERPEFDAHEELARQQLEWTRRQFEERQP